MRQKLGLRLGARGIRAIAIVLTALIELALFIVLMVAGLFVMAVFNNLVDRGVAVFGSGPIKIGLVAFLVILLATIYTLIARELLRGNPGRPEGIGRFRWLLLIFGRCWRRGLADRTVRLSYIVFGAYVLAALGLTSLAYGFPAGLWVTVVGCATPTVALTTWFQPLRGLPPPVAKDKAG